MISIETRAHEWIVGRDTGLSSKAIWSKMMTGEVRDCSHPHDPSDIGRCFRLLELIPEWKPRMSEMRDISPYWSALVDRWGDIQKSMESECGINWEKSREASSTYRLMRSILDPIMDADRKVLRFGSGATVSFS